MSGLKYGRSCDGTAQPRTWPTHYGRVPPRCPRTTINSHRWPPAATCEHEANAGFAPMSNAREHARNASLGRARSVPDRAVSHGQPRSLADKSQHRPPGLMQVTVRAVSAFHAGHEGSIPFARSNQKPQVSALYLPRVAADPGARQSGRHCQPGCSASTRAPVAYSSSAPPARCPAPCLSCLWPEPLPGVPPFAR